VEKAVYLDQNKWVDLSRARHGEDGGAPFAAALKAATEAVEAGTAMFPLSAGHYFETWKRYKGEPRRKVGGVISDLSRHRTIAGQQPLTEMEIDAALLQRFGTPDPPRKVEVFGYDAAHTFNEPALADYESWPLFADLGDADAIERELICGPVENLPIAGIAQPTQRRPDEESGAPAATRSTSPRWRTAVVPSRLLRSHAERTALLRKATASSRLASSEPPADVGEPVLPFEDFDLPVRAVGPDEPALCELVNRVTAGQVAEGRVEFHRE
jgi:hypothetical protein